MSTTPLVEIVSGGAITPGTPKVQVVNAVDLTVKESDGSPSVSPVSTIEVQGATVVDEGSGTARIVVTASAVPSIMDQVFAILGALPGPDVDIQLQALTGSDGTPYLFSAFGSHGIAQNTTLDQDALIPIPVGFKGRYLASGVSAAVVDDPTNRHVNFSDSTGFVAGTASFAAGQPIVYGETGGFRAYLPAGEFYGLRLTNGAGGTRGMLGWLLVILEPA